MKMSKKYKALLLAGVLTALGGSALAADSATAGELWNYDGLNNDGIVSNLALTIGGEKGSGIIVRNDGKSLTFQGGSIDSESIRIFQVTNGTLNFGTQEKPLESFVSTPKTDGSTIYAAGYVDGTNSVVNINATKYEQTWSTDGIWVQNGGTLNVKADTFTSNTAGTGIFVLSGSNGANPSKATIEANEVNITSTGAGGAAVWIQNNTQDATAPEGASSVSITADTINLKGEDYGVIAFSNGQVTIDGDTTIEAKNALDVRGNSTVNINADGNHSTVIKGDIVFETPNTQSDSQGSGNIIDASVNLNLSGENSSWTGSAYHEYGEVSHGVNVSGNDTYYGDVTGLSVDISNGASWNMTESSFVNSATVGDDSAINVSEAVTEFNAAEVDLDGGALNAAGGTTTINTLNASGDSTVNLENANLSIGGGTAKIAEFNASGTSTLALTDNADVTVKGGEAELTSITTGGSSSLTVGSEANVTTDTITVGGNSTLNVDSGATVSAENGITAEDSATVTLASGSNVIANMYLKDTTAKVSALGNFSGTFYSYNTDSSTYEKTSDDNVKVLLGIDSTDSTEKSLLTKGDYTVQMDVSEDGTFSIRSYDLSGTSTKIQQLGTWSAEGNYTAYGDYDANKHNISNVGTLSADKITLGGTDLQTTLDATNETVSNVITQVNTLTNNVVDITNTQNQAIANNSQAILSVKNMAANGIDQANREIHTNALAIQNNAADIANLKNLSSLSETGESNVKKLATDAVEVTGGTGITVTSTKSEDGAKITYNVSLNADTVGGSIGTGEVAADDNKLITGKTMYEELRPADGNYVQNKNTTAANLEVLDAAIGADEDYGADDALNNITKTTKNPLTRSAEETPTTLKANIGALDAAMGKVSDVGNAEKGILDKDGHLIGSAESGYGANLTDAVLAVDEKVGNLNTNNEFRDSNNKLIGKYNVLDSDESLANNLEFIDHALGNVDTKVGNLDQSKSYNVIDKTNSVNANLARIDTAIGSTADGAYVSAGNTIGQNLNALDKGLYDLDRGLSDLGDRLNKVGAGAAALAALHPEGFDPDDKLSFAVGYGHYKNANASAIGAFYKPNRDTTFSIASTIGNGSTMLNAGVSFKIGKSSHVEKTMVAKADYEALQQKVAAQDEKMAAQDAEIEELKKQVALLVAKG